MLLMSTHNIYIIQKEEKYLSDPPPPPYLFILSRAVDKIIIEVIIKDTFCYLWVLAGIALARQFQWVSTRLQCFNAKIKFFVLLLLLSGATQQYLVFIIYLNIDVNERVWDMLWEKGFYCIMVKDNKEKYFLIIVTQLSTTDYFLCPLFSVVFSHLG